MKTGRFFFLGLLMIALAAVTGFNTSAAAQNPGQSEKASAPARSLDALEKHFQNAKNYFESKDYGKAASEIRTGASVIKQEAERSAAEEKKTLTLEVEELEALANRIEKGTVKSVGEIGDSVSRAYSALADYYRTKASQSWSQKAVSQTGEYLKEAADYLEKAWQWSGRRIDAAAETAVRTAREVRDKTMAQTKWASEEVTNALDAMKAEISKLRQGSSGSTPHPLKITPTQRPGSTIFREDLSTAITKVAESAVPAVVQIEVAERREVPNPFLPFEGSPFWRKFFSLPKKMPKKFKEELMGLGTGIIVDPEGHILTNNHVVGGATEVKVLLSNGQEYSAKLVGTDPKTDLGVIKISADKPFPYLNFGNSDDVVVGQWVVAVGQPRGLSQTVTQGIISAKHRTGIIDPSGYQDFLQTDAAINPGNSGGPLLTMEGLVIGVNSAIATESGGFEGIGFSIPSNMAVRIANALIEHGKVERGWLGVSIQDIPPDRVKSLGLSTNKGALIADVMKGSPADTAGLKKGDVVLEFGGEKIADGASLRNKVAGTTIGEEVKLGVWRDKKKMEFTVKVGNLEDLTERLVAIVKQRLGVEVAPVTSQEAEQYGLPSPEGVSVQWVDPKGPLGKAGFEKGDLILTIDRVPVSGVDSFVNMVGSLPPHQKIALLARDHRTGNTGYVQVEIN
jgi:Do/DeqQ family serine protease